MRCKQCNAITRHRYAGPGLLQCEVCGTERQGKKNHGAFAELTEDENEVIHEARACGFSVFYPCLPDAETMARNTLKGAQEWLKTHSIEEQYP